MFVWYSHEYAAQRVGSALAVQARHKFRPFLFLPRYLIASGSLHLLHLALLFHYSQEEDRNHDFDERRHGRYG